MEAWRSIGCVIYAAKSTEDRRGSIPDQLAECRSTIECDPGRALAGEYVDESYSAFSADRGPGLLEAMRHCEDIARDDERAELWVQHSDRLARGDGRLARHAVELALWAMKRGIAIRTLQDPDTFRDLLYAVVTGQRNHEDSRRRSQSVAGGLRRSAERGEHHGYRPDGYMFVGEVKPNGELTKKLVIDPDREMVIRMIFRLALRGMQPGPITAAINRAGHRTRWVRGKPPVPWTVDQVGAVLRSPRYAGLSPFKGEVVAKGQWPAYITEAQHYRIIGRIGVNRPTNTRRVIEKYLLAGVGSCGQCGSRLYAMTGHERADGTFLRRYVCASHCRTYEPGRCPAPPLHADTIEAMFVNSLRGFLLDGDEPEIQESTEPSGWSYSSERHAVVAAVREGSDEAINRALEQLFIRMSPVDPHLQRLAGSHRAARRLQAVERFQTLTETERQGRSDETREETVRLNRLLRSWFTNIAVTVGAAGITIRASRRSLHGQPDTITTEAYHDLREWARTAPSTQRRHLANRRWSQPEIIGSLQAWAAYHGRSPEYADWRYAGPYNPSGLTVRKAFGTWPGALRLAGLDATYPKPAPYNTRKWTDAELIAVIRSWTSEHGHRPTVADWRRADAHHPSHETLRQHFGSFRAAMAAAA